MSVKGSQAGYRTGGDPYGFHRSLSPKGVLPQQADVVDASWPLYDNEIGIEVLYLNIDSSSFRQMKEEAKGDTNKIQKLLLETVKKRGKQQNPVTGSGGMLVGKVLDVGSALKGKTSVRVGDTIATLVSLTLTPLEIQKVKSIHLESERIEIEGRAILFESGIYSKVPSDFSEQMSLAVLDVCGAPAQVFKKTNPHEKVAILGGGGKSGFLSALAASQKLKNPKEDLYLFELNPKICSELQEFGFKNVYELDTTNQKRVLDLSESVTQNTLFDFVVNCTNVQNCEPGAILMTKDKGRILFFSMATQFSRAALISEGLGKEIELYIGNGYTKGHAEFAFNLLRDDKKALHFFERNFL